MEPVVTSIAVEPSVLTIAEDRQSMVRVLAIWSDGRVLEVTPEASIVSSNEAVVSVRPEGILAGVSVGNTLVSATWQCLEATASVTVALGTTSANCHPETDEWDVALVADTGEFFVQAPHFHSPVTFPGGPNPIQRPMSTVYQLSSTSFARAYPPGALALQLSMHLRIPWDQDAPAGPFRDRIYMPTGGTRGWSDVVQPWLHGSVDVGSAIMDAIRMHALGRSTARKIIAIYSTGGETSCTPDLRSAANSAKAQGILVAVITPLTGNEDPPVMSFCNYPASAFLTLSDAASDCLFFPSVVSGSLQILTFNSIISNACASIENGRYCPEGMGVMFL